MKLTYNEEVEFHVSLDAVSPVTEEKVDYSFPLTRSHFNEINRRLFDKVLSPVKRVLRYAAVC